MRVYEFSKKSGVPNKELLDSLKKAGFSVANHMSVLTPQAIDFLERQFTKKSEQPAKKVEREKVATKKEVVVEKVTVKEKPSVKEAPREVVQINKEVETKPVVAPRPDIARQMKPVEKEVAPTSIQVYAMTVGDFAQKIHKPVTDVILHLLKKKLPATKNQLLSEKIIADLARNYEIEPVFPVKADVVHEKKMAIAVDKLEDRKPVVVVMGHVDHGKTTLLDFIRNTRVAAKEKGGITQHIGAYEVDTAHGGIIFLDTPGHEAFSQIRVRGMKVADVAILVVAADDSVKPQTVESVKLAQSMNIPVIVAVNKIDKVDISRVDVVKRDLMKYELTPEEWGGSTIYVPISAKKGTGVDSLLEIVALQAQVMELKANPTGHGRGFVLESKLEKGRGPVATIICQEGSVKLGDFFVCGNTQGKVTTMVDSSGNRRIEVGPSIPVQVSGFEELCAVGDSFDIVPEAEYRRARASKGDRKVVQKQSAKPNAFNLIVKAEGHGSLEAVLGAILNLPVNKGDREVYIVHSGAGTITESDVILASTTSSEIVGLHVKVEPNASVLAQRNNVSIKLFDIIYRLLEDVQKGIVGLREIPTIKQKIGEAVVRKIFDIKGLGVIAGSYVKDGRITRESTVVVWRGKQKIGEGKIKSLQRDKRSVKEIHAGFECAFMVDDFNEWQEDDRVEFFIEVPQVQKAVANQ
jgi:translation initiation factor IF-2